MPQKILVLIFLFPISLFSNKLLAHCDSMDGPVVRDAKEALATKKVEMVLKWVSSKDEASVRDIFKQTIEVRSLGKDAKNLADQYFFETLVRIHRAGEGEGFTGLKPTGQVDPAIAASDKALVNKDITSLANETADAVRQGIIQRFEKALKLQQSSNKSIKAGREYVEAYVELTHFVEGVHHLTKVGADHKH